jgi:Cu+-exporting ATPase
MSTAVYAVEGMMCGGCASTVKEAVEAVAGVQSAVVDLAGKQVTVVFSAAQSDAAVIGALKGKDFAAQLKG